MIVGAAFCPGIAMANHSCDPNCEVVVVAGGRLGEPEITLALRSLRDVAAGEEATIDYLSSSGAAVGTGESAGTALAVAARRKR